EAAASRERDAKGAARVAADGCRAFGELGVRTESVQALRDLDLPLVSLDLDTNDADDHESMSDWLPQHSARDADPVEATEHNEVLSAIVDAVDGLEEREKLVMRMR